MVDIKELDAMRGILDILDPLDKGEQARVLAWISDKLEVGPVTSRQTAKRDVHQRTEDNDNSESPTFADLHNSAQPSTQGANALVAGYWLQVCQEQEQFTSQAANKELKDVGESIGNITDAFSQLMSKKPALAIQVRKSGRSRQARKKYKLTQPGIDAVKEMIKRGDA